MIEPCCPLHNNGLIVHDSETCRMLSYRDDLNIIAKELIECALQAPNDLMGEQREWYCPRLTNIMTKFGLIFPGAFVSGLQLAKDPYGESYS